MSHFCLLSDPESYVPDKIDLRADERRLTYWLDHFVSHFAETLQHAMTQYGRAARKQIAAAEQDFARSIEAVRGDPNALGDGKLDVMELCRLRDGTLRRHGLHDPFMHIKQRENVAAVELYPEVVSALHELDGPDRWLTLVRSVFAGNVFDLGSAATMHLAAQPTDFLGTLAAIKDRPWLVDDFDALCEDLPDSPPSKWSKAVIFIDNAGSDFVLGAMPFARELALNGTMIVLAANELASLNDITADETVEVVRELSAADPDLAALIRGGMFEVVSSGNDVPLIDLRNVSDELNEAAADADLAVFIGMGRSVETNMDARFTADCLKLAMLKDPVVAADVGGELFDCMCRYVRAG
jgi:type II pantothenate kinase